MTCAEPSGFNKPPDGLYENLQLDNGEIRLLSLKPDVNEQPEIICTLHRLRLADCAGQYVALSYVWGDPSSEEQVTVNGLALRITKNLACALRALRKNLDVPCPLWVDAICIQQSNIPERDHQVQMMRQIYESAGYVVAYIGPEADDSSYCLKTFARIAIAISKIPLEAQLTSELLEDFPELCKPDTIQDRDGSRAWAAIAKFFDRPYWKRMWIFQETVVARKQLIHCGDERMCFEDIECVTSLFDNIMYQEQPPFFTAGIWWRIPNIGWVHVKRISSDRQSWREGKRPTLYYLARVTLLRRASDPRDALYALVGLGTTSFPIDYSRNLNEIYCDFTARFASTEGFFAKLVRFGGIGMMIEGAQRLPSLPSWIPDWSTLWATRYMRSLEHKDYDTCPSFCGGFPNPRFSNDRRYLYVKGTVADEVSRIRAGVNQDDDSLQKTAEMFFFCTTDAFGEEITGYPTPIPRLQAVFRLLQGDIDDGTKSRLDPTSTAFAIRAAGFLTRLRYSLILIPFDWMEVASLNQEHVEAFRARILPLLNSALDESKDRLKELILGNTGRENQFQWPSLAEVTDKSDNMQIEFILKQSYTSYTRLFHTAKGYLGAGPPGMLDGDFICLIAGCRIPVVLRRVETHYILLGPCLVIGLMDGEAQEAAEKGELAWQEFEIH